MTKALLAGFVLGGVIACISIALYSAVQIRDLTARLDRLERIAIQQHRINSEVDNRLRRLDQTQRGHP